MKKRHFKATLSILLTAMLATPVSDMLTATAKQQQDLYVAILEDENGHAVEVTEMTTAQAECYQRTTQHLISFGKESYVAGLKTDKEQKEREKEQRKQEKEQEKEQKKQEKEQKQQEKKQKKLQKKERHELEKILKKSKETTSEWNYQMANIEKVQETPERKVKVALIDSGVDHIEDINVKERENFIPGQDEISILYEDLPGHGTSIAGILAAKDNDDGITGINPNMELYSARILDQNLSAPVSRVVEAIYWAIERNVNIINISFGTPNDSEVLHQAVKDAYNNGILIVAAAGNNGVLEYPAAYEEVIAVGAVDCNGERIGGSAVGDGLELMAPGDQILSTGAFGGVSVNSGTSMAVPHIVGIASLLWEKDLTCTAEFIRSVLDVSANSYGAKNEYGYGLVDYTYALEVYESLKERFPAATEETVIELYEIDEIGDNANVVSVFDDVDYVVGSWGSSNHKALAEVNSAVSGQPLSAAGMAIVKLGAVAPDTYIAGMTYYPEWHGFTSRKPGGTWQYYSNYMAAYIYLTEIAAAVNNGSNPKTVSPNVNISDLSKEKITRLFRSNNAGIVKWDLDTMTNNTYSWSTLLNGNTVNNRNKALFIYGLASHTASDMFAHSSFSASDGSYINHDNGADSVTTFPNRYACAGVFVSELIAHIKRFEVGSIQDYYNMANSSTYDGSFTLGRFSIYAGAKFSV